MHINGQPWANTSATDNDRPEHTESAPIESQRFINFCDFLADKNCPKTTIVCQLSASWRSNQEWRSIGAVTVSLFFLSTDHFSAHFYYRDRGFNK